MCVCVRVCVCGGGFNSIQFWHCLPRNWIRFQCAHLAGPPSTSESSGKPGLLPVLLTHLSKSEVPITPSLGSKDLLKQLTELRKPTDSLGYWSKGIKGLKPTAWWRDTQGEVLVVLGAVKVADGNVLVPQPGSSWKKKGQWVVLWGVYADFST